MAAPRGHLITIRDQALRRPSAAFLAVLQAVFLAGAAWLHAHGPSTAGFDRLPAEYHNHDYGFVQGQDVERLHVDDCLGCRLERTSSLPAVVAPRLVTAERLEASPPTTVSSFRSLSLTSRLPRAPPHA